MRCTICGWLIKSWPGTVDWPTATDNECRLNKITGHDTIHSDDRTRTHWPWNTQFKVQERLSPCDRSHSNQNANWVRSCRQTEKIVRIAVAGGAVVWGRSTQTTLGSAPFVYIARSLVPYSNIFGLGLGLWASTAGICWVGFPATSDATRWSLAHGRTWMTKRAMLACIFNEGRMYTELTGAAPVYTTRCRPHPNRERPIKATHTGAHNNTFNIGQIGRIRSVD